MMVTYDVKQMVYEVATYVSRWKKMITMATIKSPLDYGIKIATDYRALYEQALRRIKELEAGTKT